MSQHIMLGGERGWVSVLPKFAGMSACIIVSACILLFSCQRAPEPALPVRIAIPLQPSSALMLLAWNQGFFEEAGLAPEFILFPSGKLALEEGLRPGLADVASTSDLPVAQQLLGGADITILSTIQSIRSINAIVGRQDHGITSIRDLAGKRIGIQPLSAVHYFLNRSLLTYDIHWDAVEEVDYRIQDLVPALLAGDVDAISIREPFLSQAIDLLDTNAVVMTAPWVYPQFELLVTTPDFSRSRGDVLQRVIRSLVKAEEFMQQFPTESNRILAEVLQISKASAQDISENTVNYVFLPHSLLLSMERQILWLVERDPERLQPIDNLLDHLDSRHLHAIRPIRICAGGLCEGICP